MAARTPRSPGHGSVFAPGSAVPYLLIALVCIPVLACVLAFAACGPSQRCGADGGGGTGTGTSWRCVAWFAAAACAACAAACMGLLCVRPSPRLAYAERGGFPYAPPAGRADWARAGVRPPPTTGMYAPPPETRPLGAAPPPSFAAAAAFPPAPQPTPRASYTPAPAPPANDAKPAEERPQADYDPADDFF